MEPVTQQPRSGRDVARTASDEPQATNKVALFVVISFILVILLLLTAVVLLGIRAATSTGDEGTADDPDNHLMGADAAEDEPPQEDEDSWGVGSDEGQAADSDLDEDVADEDEALAEEDDNVDDSLDAEGDVDPFNDYDAEDDPEHPINNGTIVDEFSLEVLEDEETTSEFSIEDEGNYAVSVDSTNDEDAMMTLIGPNDEEWEDDDGGAGFNSRVTEDLESGDYTLVVEEFFGEYLEVDVTIVEMD